MKFLFGTFLGLWIGILLCATYLHTSFFPQQYDFQRALARCDADKTRVSVEVRKISNYLRGVSK